MHPAMAQEKVFNYQAGSDLTDFKNYCYFLPDSAYLLQQEPAHDAKFVAATQVDFEHLGHSYWMRFSIRNTEDYPVAIQLFLGLSEVLHFYVADSNQYQMYPVGGFESRKVVHEISGEGKTFLSQALVKIAPHETETYYAYFNHTSGGIQAKRDSQIAPQLMDEKLWETKNNTSTIIWSFIFGCFAILILYHFVYYFLTNDNIYLHYCLFVFAVSFPFLTLINDVLDAPQYNALLFFSVSGLFSVFYFQLTRKLIDIKRLLPKWDKRLKYYSIGKAIVVAIYCIAHIITNDIFVILLVYIPSIFIELVLIVALAIALVKTKDRIALLFVIGSLIAWAGMFIAIANADPEGSFIPQYHPYKFATPAYGFVLESLFFAMVLSYRAKLNEVEKKEAQDALIKQLNENKILQEKVTLELEEKVRERTQTIAFEKQKTENLLLNVLPQAIVNEMKETGSSVPKKFSDVTVLFSDFVGFTSISEQMLPEELVKRLDYLFKKFDAIVLRNGLEKIKTIGDAYMCVCGLPNPDVNHAKNAVKAALELLAFVKEFNAALQPGEKKWHLRIGIQTGQVVAGVIGDYKFTYDVWGDTVNTASRLEQHSEPGKVNISADVYDLIKEDFACEKRGSFQVKNKGEIFMYFVDEKKAVAD